MARAQTPLKIRRRRDLSRLAAKLLCALFALIGAIPLLAGVLVRSEPLERWASAETARVLKDELGVTASYRVRMRLWPLELAIEELVVPSSDGGAPALQAARIAVTPRVFSLLAGRLDVGHIEIERPRGRVVIRDGEIRNVRYRLPERRGDSPRMTRAPFSALSLVGGRFEVHIDDRAVLHIGTVDVDVFAESGPSFEVSVTAGESRATSRRKLEARKNDKGEEIEPARTEHDDDVLCRLELRARVEPDGALVRRLALLAIADLDPATRTSPHCPAAEAPEGDDPARVVARASQVRLVYGESGAPVIDGHVVARAPTRLANRFVRMMPLRGWVGFGGDLRYDGTTDLPNLRGKLKGGGIGFDVYDLAKHLDVDVEISADVIEVPRFEMGFADGRVVLKGATIRPFAEGVPLRVERVDGTGMRFEGLMRDLGVTPNTIVEWGLDKTRVTKIGGTLDPLKIDADLYAETSDFEVFDRAFHDAKRQHMIGVRSALVRGRLGVRPDAFLIYDTRADFGKSSVNVKLVSIGFHNDIELVVTKGSRADLADLTPLIDIPMAGVAELSAKMGGKANDPLLEGEIAVSDFRFGGFPLGDVKSGKFRFKPLKVDLRDVHATKGRSDFVVSSARLDFDSDASLVVDANVTSEKLDIRDFFAMWHFDADPRYDPIHGEGKVAARVQYVLGGPRDRCKGGWLRVDGNLSMRRMELFEEHYDSGQAQFDFRWIDRDASHLGVELDVPSVSLKKGSGTLLGSLNIRPGGVVNGHVVGTAVPISKIDSLGALALAVDGKVNAVAEIGGTIDTLTANTSVRVSPVRLGSATLPPSSVSVELRPMPRKLHTVGTTSCGRPAPAPFDRADWDSDAAQGVFHTNGEMFGGQIALKDVRTTRQRAKTVRGQVVLKRLDIGALGQLSPMLALAEDPPRGKLSGVLDLEQLELEKATRARATFQIDELEVRQGTLRAEVLPATAGSSKLRMAGGRLELPALALAVSGPRGRGVLDVSGSVEELGSEPRVDARLALRPVDLSKLAAIHPRIERIQGSLRGEVSVRGPVRTMRYSGGFQLENGELTARGLPAPLSDVNLALGVDGDELRLRRGSAKFGGGTLSLTGSAPLRGTSLGEARLQIKARQVSLAPSQGVRTTLDADLVTTWRPPSGEAEASLPRITGDITLRSFEYTRPVTMTADISTLAQRGKRTDVEAYDRSEDSLEVDLTLRANRPLQIRNELVEAELVTEREGLAISGTNQRIGARGTLKLKPGGRIHLRRNEFEVRQGHVRFDDATRIAPQVDVTAVTEYRRYSDAVAAVEGGGGDATTGGGAAGATGGRWLVTMHAHGDADKLKIDLTSDPALAQDDIFLLLTVGLTRAELDQAQSASVGGSVALEALGTLTGADRAVKDAVPVIDEFRFGSAYSSRTGRTEPTVTIGKRLAERIRANVTSGVAESREIRSNVEWRLSPRVSLEGSYDNVNDISSSSLGNLGADVRWRLEFE